MSILGTFPNDLNFMNTKSLLTKIVCPKIPESIFDSYFADLWKNLVTGIGRYIASHSILDKTGQPLKPVGEKIEVWDVFRFCLKGGTSILKSLHFIMDMKEDDDGRAAHYAQSYQKSDWDSQIAINPRLSEINFYEIYEIFVDVVYSTIGNFIGVVDSYINSNYSDFVISFTDKKTIDEIFHRIDMSTVRQITGIQIIPSVNRSFHQFFDWEKDRNYYNYYNTLQHQNPHFASIFSSKLAEKFRKVFSTTQSVSTPDMRTGRTRNMYSASSGTMAIFRFIRDEFAPNNPPKVDLLRILVNFELTVDYIGADGKYGQATLYGVSELIDMPVDLTNSKFDGLEKEKMLPTESLHPDYLKNSLIKLEYPVIGLDYNIEDQIRVMNDGSDVAKVPKKCERTKQLLALKCKSEKIYNFTPVNVPQGKGSCDITINQLNEDTCRNIGVDWGACGSFSKRDLVNMAVQQYNLDPQDVWNIKKKDLCNIFKTIETWQKSYPEIATLITAVGSHIFDIIKTEFTIHPRFINPILKLPDNLLDALYLKNIFVDMDFIKFVTDIRLHCTPQLLDACEGVVKDLRAHKITDITSPFLIGELALNDVYHRFLIKNPGKIQPPRPSSEFQIKMYTTNMNDDIMFNILNTYLSIIDIQSVVATLNQNPRFKLVAISSLRDHDRTRHWKYLEDSQRSQDEIFPTSDKFTFTTLENDSKTITARLNVIVADTMYKNFYRTVHIAEFIIDKVAAIPPLFNDTVRPNKMFSQHTSIYTLKEDVLLDEFLKRYNENKRKGNSNWAINYDIIDILCILDSQRMSRRLTSKQETICSYLQAAQNERNTNFSLTRDRILQYLQSRNL